EHEPDRQRRRRNLEPDAAAWLWWHVQAVAATRVVEIGTSNGYSTIWLADAVGRTGGRLTSVDVADQTEARGHLHRAGVTAGVVARDPHRAAAGRLARRRQRGLARRAGRSARRAAAGRARLGDGAGAARQGSAGLGRGALATRVVRVTLESPRPRRSGLGSVV